MSSSEIEVDFGQAIAAVLMNMLLCLIMWVSIGFVFSKLWLWVAVPFGVPELSMMQAIC